MRKMIVCLMAILMLLPLTAYASESDGTYVIEDNGISFTVNPEGKTITVDGNVYRYQVNTSGEKKTTTITYPNGATYYWTQEEYMGFGGWSDNYDPDTYLDGQILVDIVDQIRPAKGPSGKGIEINIMNVLMGLVVIIIGIYTAAHPENAWYWSNGWKFKNAEPSDLALAMSRVGGIVMVIGGILMFFL